MMLHDGFRLAGGFGPGFPDGGFLGGLLPLAMLALAILAGMALVRHFNEPRRAPGPAAGTLPRSFEPEPDPALAIARERLARGELSVEEFEAIRRALG
ncbi:MAG TPA: SHOCT domain-containing protein [Deinococcales bacterium]|nr:SHOCT domain-containing protein [Deinococcales bacterium]